mmetsp:Transcript_71228/g.112810  ORF Transcript_71228/g.112810 Transcript_71228/m.112810 type:complete len:247 (+) Transcript_71228:59-799(+)|eukprot:CAMPEP_0169111858 /NCGR_PEP_ID=MMETSP1015-20121227/27304_1 /TAXON_ID=342587 /ORGANISM="Karlodinium micrum, Strain CCMP2283" /LENGTH=246 /DNA_ID=CAMNT_0009173813 /DNA_START=59 /DNA_END=799 /DNA_ORIENTATION=-
MSASKHGIPVSCASADQSRPASKGQVEENSLAPKLDAPTNVQSELNVAPPTSYLLCGNDETLPTNDMGTPRARNTRSVPPQPSTPHVKRCGLLFKALKKNDIEEVRKVFRNNADALSDYFWDNHFEPPLCAAVHLKCNADIIRFLIEQGADATMKDRHGRTAFAILNQKCGSAPGYDAAYTHVKKIEAAIHPLEQFFLPSWQSADVVGQFMQELDRLTGSFDLSFSAALVDQREAWRCELSTLLEA